MNINSYGGAGVFKWTKEYLVKVLSTGKDPILTNTLLINAFKKIDRKDFVPHQLENLAYEDKELDIGYNESLTRPVVIGQMLSILDPQYGGKYLDIGTGTGYVAAILAFVSGDKGAVYSIERIQWLWETARQNIKKYPNLKNVNILYRDGMEGLQAKAPFDGIHISFAMDEIPENLKMQLKLNNGKLVCPTVDHNLRVIERLSREEFQEEIIPGFTFTKGKEGTA